MGENAGTYVDAAKRLYPLDDYDKEIGRGFPSCPYDYTPIIEHFGTVAIRADDEDYQGDSRVLYADTGKGFGYLQFGWGSCSGCDSLQGCSSYADLARLIEQLDRVIHWAPREELLKFFKEHDWEGDYSHNSKVQKKFVRQVISYLGAA